MKACNEPSHLNSSPCHGIGKFVVEKKGRTHRLKMHWACMHNKLAGSIPACSGVAKADAVCSGWRVPAADCVASSHCPHVKTLSAPDTSDAVNGVSTTSGSVLTCGSAERLCVQCSVIGCGNRYTGHGESPTKQTTARNREPLPTGLKIRRTLEPVTSKEKHPSQWRAFFCRRDPTIPL